MTPLRFGRVRGSERTLVLVLFGPEPGVAGVGDHNEKTVFSSLLVIAHFPDECMFWVHPILV